VLLGDTGHPAEALATCERARAIRERLARDNPAVTDFQRDLAASHYNIGHLLSATGRPAEALAAYERARAIFEPLARDHPDSPDHASELGGTLNNLATLDLDAKRFAEARDKLRQAIAWQKKALAANPRHPQYRQFLANHLTNLLQAAQGLGDDALAAEARRGLDELQASEPRLMALDARLAAVRAGAAPRDNAERLALAQRAYDTRRHATAARLWTEALDSDPKLAEDRRAQHRYNAACAAALAAAGRGEDEPASDAAMRTGLRQQALGWLKGELAVWESWLEKGPAQARATVAGTLRHWQQDPDLAGVRDPGALLELPERERQHWQALWAEVDAQLRRAGAEGVGKLAPPAGELPADPFARCARDPTPLRRRIAAPNGSHAASRSS
jgi:tetratricopeptide (TPR) repeat protein